MAAILALAAATAYGVALWKAPVWMHATTPQDRHNARVLVISVGGAAVVAAGLLYTARNFRLSRRGQVTDRFAVALERLGSAELYVRIGGVKALEHVMHDSAYHHKDVVQVLNEFIRGAVPHIADQSGRQAGPAPQAAPEGRGGGLPAHRPGPVWMHPVTGSVRDLPDIPPVPAPDVQAALTALAHRPLRPERWVIDLTRLHLRYADLRGANLTSAWLYGVDLTGATLYRANLTYADLRGANLTGAMLARADLHGARFDGADLTGARFDEANLTRAYMGKAILTDAHFDAADLTGAYLGKDPLVVPGAWIVTDPETGELGSTEPPRLHWRLRVLRAHALPPE